MENILDSLWRDIYLRIVCCIISLSLGVTTEAISEIFTKVHRLGVDDDDDDFLHRHDGADRRDFGTDAVESYSGVREVELEMAVGNVTVERHDGDTIEVETVGVAEELKFHSYMEENTLKLEAKKRVTGIEGQRTVQCISGFREI